MSIVGFMGMKNLDTMATQTAYRLATWLDKLVGAEGPTVGSQEVFEL
jgi:hypothetical protein